MTSELFREDGYLKECEATVTELHETGFSCDQTVFYATGGGQPGDTGVAVTSKATEITISNTVKDRESGVHLHCTEALNELSVGDKITLKIDWEKRYRFVPRYQRRLQAARFRMAAVALTSTCQTT